MKNLFTIAILLFTAFAQSQNGNNPNKRKFLTVSEDDIRTQFSLWIDPTLTDKGAQFGIDATMVMHWGFVGASISTYPELEDGYTDVVGQLGVNWHFFEYKPVRYYIGGRLGRVFRDGGFELAGVLGGFDWRLTRSTAPIKVYAGIKLWIDYREDQKNRAYGDSDAYKKGLITNNPLLQENGAFIISFSL